MNREELITYLDAVCDAESAVDACETIIMELKNKIAKLYLPPEPTLRPEILPNPMQLPKLLPYPSMPPEPNPPMPVQKAQLRKVPKNDIDTTVHIGKHIGTGCAIGIIPFGIIVSIASQMEVPMNFTPATSVTVFVIALLVAIGTAISIIPNSIKKEKEDLLWRYNEAEKRIKAVEEENLRITQEAEKANRQYIQQLATHQSNYRRRVQEIKSINEARVREAEDQYKAHLQDVEAKNQNNQALHQTQIILHTETCRLIESTRKALLKQLEQQEKCLLDCCRKKEQLYARGIIYETNRNMIAVFAIREYLKMGICTELEGVHGAYSQYMMDVRAERICGSIRNLRDAVISSISQMQVGLYSQLRTIQQQLQSIDENMFHNINQLNADLQQSINWSADQLMEHTASLERAVHLSIDQSAEHSRQLEHTLQQTHLQTTEVLNTHLSSVGEHLVSANAQLSKIQEDTSLIALNQYIANRMAGVDAYLA